MILVSNVTTLEIFESDDVANLCFFKLLLSNCLNWKFTAIIILHFHLHPQFKYELFHIYFTCHQCVEKIAEYLGPIHMYLDIIESAIELFLSGFNNFPHPLIAYSNQIHLSTRI